MELTNQQVDPSKQQIDPDVLKEIKYHLGTWKKMANLLQVSVIVMGLLAIVFSLFISAFAGTVSDLAVKIIAFSATLFITLITAFNLPTKASNVRNAWRHLNKAIYSFKINAIDAPALIKAYEEGENMLGSVDFNYKKSQVNNQNDYEEIVVQDAADPKVSDPKNIEPKAVKQKTVEPVIIEPGIADPDVVDPIIVDAKTN